MTVKSARDISTLDEVENFAISELVEAATNRKHSFRNAVFSTIGDAGPTSRILVLRKATDAPFAIQFHTDTRSGKVTDLRHDSRASVLFWNPDQKIQVRLNVEAEMRSDTSETAAAWKNIPVDARNSYNTDLPPGSKTQGIAWRPAEQRKAADAKFFGIIHGHVTAMEVLVLRREGHLRARFTYGAKGRGMASFLVP